MLTSIIHHNRSSPFPVAYPSQQITLFAKTASGRFGGNFEKKGLKFLEFLPPPMHNFDHEKVIKILSQKDKEKILYRGFSYNLRKKNENKYLWRCRKGTCSAFLHTTPELGVLKLSFHNHMAHFEKILLSMG
ncbi:hypothetical protein DMUE_3840 [Dictyocoela muelleri]|nr:hypothetical protein DMUE_3840 [Dictyocoela muelleri]